MTSDFYDKLKAEYEPNMTDLQFSELMGGIELNFFNAHPELWDAEEAVQNEQLVEHMRELYVKH